MPTTASMEYSANTAMEQLHPTVDSFLASPAFAALITPANKAVHPVLRKTRRECARTPSKPRTYCFHCGRIGYTGPTGRTRPSPNPSDPTAYCTYTVSQTVE